DLDHRVEVRGILPGAECRRNVENAQPHGVGAFVEAEILRLETRLPELDDPQRDEVAKTVRRVVDKLLHAPTVRVKQLASTPNGDHYAEALRELFELKPGAAEAVSAPDHLASDQLGDFSSDPIGDRPINQADK
ncbi:hypothetical protein ABZW74_24515, partial [Gordonia sp. NPDC003585]